MIVIETGSRRIHLQEFACGINGFDKSGGHPGYLGELIGADWGF